MTDEQRKQEFEDLVKEMMGDGIPEDEARIMARDFVDVLGVQSTEYGPFVPLARLPHLVAEERETGLMLTRPSGAHFWVSWQEVEVLSEVLRSELLYQQLVKQMLETPPRVALAA